MSACAPVAFHLLSLRIPRYEKDGCGADEIGKRTPGIAGKRRVAKIKNGQIYVGVSFCDNLILVLSPIPAGVRRFRYRVLRQSQSTLPLFPAFPRRTY